MGKRVADDNVNLDLWRNEQNSQALDKLIRRYERNVFSFILYQSTCDWNEAYEATADCLSDAFNSMKSAPGPPLPVVIFRDALDRCRNVKAAPLFNPIQFLNASDVRKKILRPARRALTMLTFEEKAMLLLRDQINLPYEDIARIMDMSLKEIKTRIWQARNNFRDKVDEVINRDRGGQ